MEVAVAIKELRLHERLSQQEFASRYGLAVSTIQNLEAGLPPSLKTLVTLFAGAEQAERFDLADVLRAQIFVAVGGAQVRSVPRDEFQAIAADYLFTCLEDPGKKHLAASVLKALYAVRHLRKEERSGLAAAFREITHQRFLEEAVKRGYADFADDAGVVWRTAPEKSGKKQTKKRKRTK
jgi:transcriptional regulator with XRE-family HTH domain